MGCDRKIKLLINLPDGYFREELLKSRMERIEKIADITRTSCNTADEIAPYVEKAEAVIMWAWPALNDEILARCPDLKFFGLFNGTPVTVRAAIEKNIVVSEVRHCWSPAVAELALCLMLNGLRLSSKYHIQMRQGSEHWVSDFPVDIDKRERQLTGRAVGIVGFGRIGQRLAELLEPFHVMLRVYDPFLPSDVVKKYGVELVELDELFRKSEIVVLCAARNAGSERMVQKHHIDMLKLDSVLVNIGRSWLIDMEALEQRIRRGDLIVMLDVFENEPLSLDHPLRSLPNAFLTPHRGGGIMESLYRAFDMVTDDLEAYLQGMELKYRFTREMLHCI